MTKTKKKKSKNPPHITLGKPGPKPIEFSEDDIAKIKRLSGILMSKEDIAIIMGVSKTTFYELIKKDPRITNALDLGPKETRAAIQSKMIQKAVKGDQRAAEFVLERKLGWKKEAEEVKQDVHFVVEMTETGKFKNSRPRQIEGGETIDIDIDDEKEIKEIEDEREEW